MAACVPDPAPNARTDVWATVDRNDARFGHHFVPNGDVLGVCTI